MRMLSANGTIAAIMPNNVLPGERRSSTARSPRRLDTRDRHRWRECMGVEPTRDGATAPQTVLKTVTLTGALALPRALWTGTCAAASATNRR